ncbi:hypothetical protein HanRHA438_Chr01g0021061 [Helianthus annuus]|nr:hypothetical protein HanRHA438_Chr01g0021061 [Helianthus annuus]
MISFVAYTISVTVTRKKPKQEPTSNGPEPAPEMVIPVNDNVMNLDQSEFSSFTSDELGWKTWNSDNVIISLTDMIVEDLVEEELVEENLVEEYTANHFGSFSMKMIVEDLVKEDLVVMKD